MAIERQDNWLSQQRVEISDLRSLESAVCYDFDTGFGFIQAGQDPLVVSGLTISVTGAAGNPASNLVLNTANSVILHPLATESGTIFRVPSTQAAEQLSATNAVIIGSFSAGIINYIGLDLIRTADPTTADLTKFLDANTLKEVALTVPKARTLVYRIYITQSPFSVNSNVLPIATVLTDSSNNVSTITDARQMFYRLGIGGDIPNALASYNWPDATRSENPIVYNPPTSSADPFAGGDKGISSLKSVLAAIQSSLWEVRGGSFWYSPTNRDNVQMLYTSSVLSNGDNFSFSGSTLKWQGLKMAFENSAVSYNVIQDNASTGVTLLDQQCLYVDIQRGSVATIVPGVAYLTALGTPVIPGTRFIMAWREGADVFTRNRAYQVGRNSNLATTSAYGVVELHQAALTPGTAIVFSDGDKDTATGIVGLNANRQASVTSTSGNAITGTASAGSADGVFGQGHGTGSGVDGTGGATAGAGVSGTGGVGGPGVFGTGGSNGPGVSGNGGTGNANGVQGAGVGTGTGVQGTGGNTDGRGMHGTGEGVGDGVWGDGGSSGGIGVRGTGRSGAVGVIGIGNGAGAGVQATKGGSATAAFTGDGNLDLSAQTHPPTTQGIGTGIFNVFNNCRVWGLVFTDGAGNATVLAGQNIASAAISGSAVQINYTTAFTSGDTYAMMIADIGGVGAGYSSWGQAPGNVLFQTSGVNYSTHSSRIIFMAFGT